MNKTLPSLEQPTKDPASAERDFGRRSGGNRVASGLIAAGALFLCLLWAYWPTFALMVQQWATNPQYSHGFLVPVFAGFVLWSRRSLLPPRPLVSNWWGLAFLATAFVMRFVAAYIYFIPLDGFSLILMLTGTVLLLGGWPLLRWCWPGIAFLAFMLPLPFQIETAMAYPLRRLATVCSTYLLQTFGYPAFAEGNIILIEELQLEVIDACNGLGMLFTFFALATAVALIIDRPILDRWIIVASAVPIALVVNILRITITGVTYAGIGEEAGRLLMHDLAGWIMMPMALGILWLELKFLSMLLVEVDEDKPLAVDLAGMAVTTSHRKNSRPLPYQNAQGQPASDSGRKSSN